MVYSCYIVEVLAFGHGTKLEEKQLRNNHCEITVTTACFSLCFSVRFESVKSFLDVEYLPEVSEIFSFPFLSIY